LVNCRLDLSDECNQRRSVDELEQFALSEISGVGRKRTACHEDAPLDMLGMDEAEEFADLFDADLVVLPVLALDEPLAVLLEHEVDTPIRGRSTGVSNLIASASIRLADEFLELLPTHGANGLYPCLAVEESALLPLPDEGERNCQQDEEGDEPSNPLGKGRNECVTSKDSRHHVPEDHIGKAGEDHADPPGAVDEIIEQLRRVSTSASHVSGLQLT